VDHKDIFIEVDAMTGIPVDPLAIADVVAKFADAPRSWSIILTPPKASICISTWHDGDGHRQETVDDPGRNGWPMSFDLQKSKHFGTRPSSRSQGPCRQALVYRYCIFAILTAPRHPVACRSSAANDFFVTLGGWRVSGGTKDQQAGTLMHELGHTLGSTTAAIRTRALAPL